ncbi:MAG: hypothetical protein ACRD90_04030 [Nitrosopumilaceae archaeon]
MSSTNLSFTPIKQEAWYKQIREDIAKGKRPIDRMSIAEIKKLYEEKKFLCDSCGKEIGKCDYTLEEHVLHLINPSYLWTCEDCYQSDLRSDRIIAMTEEPKPEVWQDQNK